MKQNIGALAWVVFVLGLMIALCLNVNYQYKQCIKALEMKDPNTAKLCE